MMDGSEAEFEVLVFFFFFFFFGPYKIWEIFFFFISSVKFD